MRELPDEQICERKLEVYLQNYLNEFCYKFNQRYFGNALFDWLKATALAYKKDYRYNIASSFFIIWRCGPAMPDMHPEYVVVLWYTNYIHLDAPARSLREWLS